MRILGVDFGDRNIGLAVSDKLLITAQALGSYRVKNEEEDKKYFKDLVLKYEIEEIVIGLPLRMDGTPGTRVQKTQKFASWLENVLKLPIVFWDERLTTKQALDILNQQKISGKKKKKLKDQISATIILSVYLESKRKKSNAHKHH
ncbi:MAG: Holliday junction resolvase RuvX [Candidatus Aminicenantes bacterium]|nr:MAG: Holliday junction resolvase RuvX [Candidatus Aminicenantes bacterium]TET69903.1 MAG: Holliday junction resolvase RuvX [Candidatus Aminicenantes bacterium]